MRRISGVVLVVALLLAACSRSDDLNVGLEPQLGNAVTFGIDLSIGANLYAMTVEETATYGDFDALRIFGKATLSRFDTEGNILWERNIFGFSDTAAGLANDFPPSLDQGLVDSDGSGNAYGFTEVDYTRFCPSGSPNVGDPYGDYDNRLTKVSPTGARLWSKKITGEVRGFAVDRAGNTYLTGLNDLQPCDEVFAPILFLRKYAPDGSLVWSRGLSDFPESLAVTPWGSAFVATYNYAGDEREAQLNRYTVEGKLLWKKTIDLDNLNKLLFSKNYVYTLSLEFAGNERQNKLDKYDLKGNLVRSLIYADSQEKLPDLTFDDLTVDPAGNVIMAGSYGVSNNSGGFIRKVSATGKTLWTKTPESLQRARLSSIGNRDNGGSIYVGGSTPNGSGIYPGGEGYRSLVSRLDRGGNQVWTIR